MIIHNGDGEHPYYVHFKGEFVLAGKAYDNYMRPWLRANCTHWLCDQRNNPSEPDKLFFKIEFSSYEHAEAFVLYCKEIQDNLGIIFVNCT